MGIKFRKWTPFAKTEKYAKKCKSCSITVRGKIAEIKIYFVPVQRLDTCQNTEKGNSMLIATAFKKLLWIQRINAAARRRSFLLQVNRPAEKEQH